MSVRRALIFAAVLVLLTSAYWYTSQRHSAGENQAASPQSPFNVGFLPVTCHLTCPVTHFINEELDAKRSFTPIRFNGFPEMKEAFISGALQATFIIAPLAMKMREQGVPIKIVYLGHRDGTTLMVHTESSIRDLKDLEGKKIAIPSYYSNQHLILFKAFKERGIHFDKDLLIEMPPPEMPVALAQKQVDAIIAGEPLMAKTEMEGYGRVLFMTKDVWPEFISCVLAVREDVIATRREEVEHLVQGIARSGKWLDEDRLGSMSHRMQAAEIAAQKQYYNQKPELIRFVLSKPPDRVKYTNLHVQKPNFEEIERLGQEAGIFEGKTQFEDYADTSFVKAGMEPSAWKWEKTQ